MYKDNKKDRTRKYEYSQQKSDGLNRLLCHTPSLHLGSGWHLRTIAGPKRTLGLADLLSGRIKSINIRIQFISTKVLNKILSSDDQLFNIAKMAT